MLQYHAAHLVIAFLQKSNEPDSMNIAGGRKSPMGHLWGISGSPRFWGWIGGQVRGRVS